MEQVLYFLGSIVCHQIPDRTIMIGDKLLPVCARDTGIYIGMFVSFIFFILYKRINSNMPPKLKYAIIACLMIIPLMIDGIASYAGLWTSNNLLRILTGALFGTAVPIFIIPLINYKAERANNREVVKNFNDMLLLVFSSIGISLIIYYHIISNWFLESLMIFTAMFCSYYLIVFVILSQVLKIKKPWNKAGLTLLLTISLFTLLTFITNIRGI